MATAESRLTTKMKQYLEGRFGEDIWVFKVHGSASQVSGVPDLLCCLRGLFIGIEVKIPGKENYVSARQVYILERIDRAGGIQIVVSSISALEQALDTALHDSD